MTKNTDSKCTQCGSEDFEALPRAEVIGGLVGGVGGGAAGTYGAVTALFLLAATPIIAAPVAGALLVGGMLGGAKAGSKAGAVLGCVLN